MTEKTIYEWFYEFGSENKVSYKDYKNYAVDRLNISRGDIEDLQFPEQLLKSLYEELTGTKTTSYPITEKDSHEEEFFVIKKYHEEETPADIELSLKTAKDISSIAINFDWETAFKIEKMLGNIKDDEFAFDEFKSQIMDNTFHFVCDCIKNNHKDYFMEFVHSMRLEYKDGTVTLRYQPVVWDNYD